MSLADFLADARHLAQQIAANSSNAVLPSLEIARLIDAIPRAQLDELVATLEREAQTGFDEDPRAARGLARVAYELARADSPARAHATLTLARALNRLGDFRDALPLCRDAAMRLAQIGNPARAWREAALANYSLGDLDAARNDLQRARAADDSALMRARCDQISGHISIAQGQSADAETRFVQARDAFRAAQLPLEAARCEYGRAQIYFYSDRDPLPLLEPARAIFESARCGLDVALCDLWIALVSQKGARYQESIELLNQARQSFSDFGADYFVALCDMQLGISHRHLNHFDRALVTLRASRDYFRLCAATNLASVCDINLANAYYVLNRYAEALTLYQEAADLSLAEGRAVRVARVYNNMGLIYAKQGQFAQSLDLHQRALQIAAAKNLPQLAAGIHGSLAACYRQLGQYAEALTHLHTRATLIPADQREAQIQCALELAELHLLHGELTPAVTRLERARRAAAEDGLDHYVATCDRLLAQVEARRSRKARARKRIENARALFLKHAQIVDAALCDLTEGELSLQWNEVGAAQRFFKRARARLAPAFPDQAWRADYGLARCAESTGDRGAALRRYLRAVRAIATARAALVTEQISSDFFARRQSVYEDALALALAERANPAALEIIEASKARAFLALIQQRGWQARRAAADGYSAGLIEREQQLRNDLDALRRQIALQPPDLGDAWRGRAATFTAALDELDALSRAYESVVTQLRVARGGLAGVPAPTPFALKDFRAAAQRAFGDDWVALDYALSEEQVIIARVTPDAICVERKTLSDYDRHVLQQCASVEPDLRERIYRGTLRGQRVPPVGDKHLRYLYRLLIPEAVTAHTLILAPHRALHHLPFHALIAPRGNYLVETHALVYAPSLQILQHLLNQAGAETINAALVCGLADFGDALTPLPNAAREVDALRVIFERGEFLWGADATRQKLLALDACGVLQKFNLLHFATHALLDRAAPHQSRIVLSDAPLTTFDILDLTLNARLVTLSACQTALGTGGTGDEWIGIARAFFYAGARALLATLWHVEDDSTADAITRVYRRLAQGKNIAEALRAAQIEMIRAGCPPYQWASFALMGRP